MLPLRRFLGNSLASLNVVASHQKPLLPQATGTFSERTEVTQADKEFLITHSDEVDRELLLPPVVVVLGWAGASHKTLSKYSQLYNRRGLTTAQFVLPPRFLFRHVEQAPEALDDVARFLKEQNAETPVIVHCMCDAGTISFQGLSIACEARGLALSPVGIVWDSCPGPGPLLTIFRSFAFSFIVIFSRMRDRMGLGRAIVSSYADIRDNVWRNFLRKLRGLEAEISTMDGVWSGFWARALPVPAREVFIFSNNDFWTPCKYVLEECIPDRRSVAKSVAVLHLDKSPHVGHLKSHPGEYSQSIQHMLEQIQEDLKVARKHA